MSLLSRVLRKGARHAGRVALRVSPVTKSTARNAVIAASAAGAAIAALGYTSASPALAEAEPSPPADEPLTELYPPIEPYRTGRLRVSPLHEIYFEESGNPEGKPVIFVHGGPGGGTNGKYRRFFDPAKYRIIIFDQRGCGKSTPHACLEDNTTWSLIGDMEKLRRELGVEQWQVFGGSWGSTLGLSYAIMHPDRVTELVMRGIFMLRKKELEWYYQEGASNIYPDRWEGYRDAIDPLKRGNFMKAYRECLTGDDEEAKMKCAKAWTRWEMTTSQLEPEDAKAANADDGKYSLAFARIENHYFINGGFFPSDAFILDNVYKIRHIPTVIVQGRYDVVCPAKSAWDLHREFPESKLHLVQTAGHSCYEKGITSKLVQATNDFAK